MTASLLKFPEPLSVFWTILVMLLSGWSLLDILFLRFPLPLQILWWLYRAYQLQLLSLSLSCSIVFFLVLKKGLGSFLSFRFLSVLLCDLPIWQTPLFGWFSFLTLTMPGRLAKIRWSVCISKSLRSSCVSFSRIDFALCIYHLFVWSNFNFLHNS